MRRLIPLVLLLLAACLPVTPLPEATAPARLLPTPSAAVVLPPPASPTAVPAFQVLFHPDGGLYVGDLVSIAVVAPPGLDTTDLQVQVQLEGEILGSAGFSPYGAGGRNQATLLWAWDTSPLPEGEHTLTLAILPGNLQFTQTVTLRPAAALPAPGAQARWETTTTDCCVINYISGTEAERDLLLLSQLSEAESAQVSAAFGAAFPEKIPVTFLPRTLGHGGFAGDAIYVSYLDRNYAGSTTAQVLHHEMVHWLDARLGGKYRPTILAEGLAVYLSGGHFKPEPLFARGAALLDSGRYIPLRQLADDFYPSQHEIGYLQGALLVGYLVERYTFPAFDRFYRDIDQAASGLDSDALDAAARRHFNLSLDQLEGDLIAFLQQTDYTEAQRLDLELTVAFYDTVRRYQSMLDPSAYFLHAWLPPAADMRQRGIVADYLRRPLAAVNIGLETMLVEAEKHLREGRLDEAAAAIQTINVMLDILAQPGADSRFQVE